ncbi:hypothetical protein F5H01DRAFT_418161 [Linnemannia elongata]|nr:hypothetical protein F5H01DRAFT_418161 [Linnemannia elongata]
MSSGKARSKGGNSPTSSPPLPPAPTQAKNRGAAAPHHYQTELASPEAAAAAATKAGSGGLTPTRTRSNNNINGAAASASTKRGGLKPTQAPPALANGTDVIQSTTLQKKSSLRRLVRRGVLLYLAYTFFFVCPSLPNTKSNYICDRFASLQDRLRPYTEPAVEKAGETYKTYGEPYVNQYGRPLYSQGQKYYADVAQPVIKTASVKVKDAYHQYAHPHVNKAYQTVYTPQVKAHVNRAQTAFNGYQKQAQDQLIHARKLSKDANDHIWRLHAAHVQPGVDKLTPHAKVAWNHASLGAHRVYDSAKDLYLKHVNPYAQQTYTVLLDAADNARESFAFHTDEIWGTKLSKRHKKSKAARAADAAADKARQAKLAAENVAQQAAKKLKREPEPETFKDTLLKKAAEAQKLAGEYAEGAREAIHDTVMGAQKAAGDYSDTIKAAVYGSAGEAKKAADQAAKDAQAAAAEKAHGAQKVAKDAQAAATEKVYGAQKAAKDAQAAAAEKAYGAQKVAEEFIENVREATAEKAHDAQKAASDNAEYLKKTADDKVHEAGKLSERIKKAVIDKAHEAQEAVARQAEHIRHAARGQVEHVQEAGAHLRDSVVGAGHDAKETVDKEAEYVADVAQKKKQQAEMEARKLADQAARVAQESYDAAAGEANEIKAKVVKTAQDADQAIRHKANEASQQAQNAFGYVEEETEESKAKANKAAKKAKKAAHKQAKEFKKSAEKAAHDGQEYMDVPVEAAENAKDFVVQHVKDASDQAGQAAANAKDYVVKQVKDASDQAGQAAETAKQKVFDAGTASKASLAAMLAGIEESFGHFYDYEDTETKTLWSKLQSAIDEHVESAKKSAQDLEKANREAYESFESYVRDWRNQGGGNLEDRLAKLKEQSIESVKNIGQRAESDQTAAKSKVKVLSNNVEVYLNGLKDFLADRLEASKETIASDLNVFKDTSSKDDEKTVRDKLAQLETAARTRMDDAGKDAHAKAQQLLKQVEEIWSKSEVQSRELAAKAQELAKKTSEDAQWAIKHAVGSDEVDDKKEVKDEEAPGSLKRKFHSGKDTAANRAHEEAPGSLKSKIHSVKDAAANRAHEATDKVEKILQERRDSGFSGSAIPADSENADNVRVVTEEPGSGHRHHRY